MPHCYPPRSLCLQTHKADLTCIILRVFQAGKE